MNHPTYTPGRSHILVHCIVGAHTHTHTHITNTERVWIAKAIKVIPALWIIKDVSLLDISLFFSRPKPPSDLSALNVFSECMYSMYTSVCVCVCVCVLERKGDPDHTVPSAPSDAPAESVFSLKREVESWERDGGRGLRQEMCLKHLWSSAVNNFH